MLQLINNNRTSALERTAALATGVCVCVGGLNAFYWCQTFALDSVVVKTPNIFRSHGLQCIITDKNTLIKSTYFDETKKIAHY